MLTEVRAARRAAQKTSMNINLTPIKSHYDALVQALVLAVIAPDEQKAQAALKLAESVAAGLKPKQVTRAKRAAEEILAAVDFD